MAHRFRCLPEDCRSDRCPAKKTFSCVSVRMDTALTREMLPRRYGAGVTLIHDDTHALVVLAICSGTVKLTRTTEHGHEVVVGLRGPGDLLGVREVLAGLPFQVSVETVEASVLCAVPREVFLEAVQECHELPIRLLRQLAHEDLTTESRLVERTSARVDARTARLLVEFVGGSHPGAVGRSVPLPREEMARRIGTTRETLSRALHRLVDQGAVQLEGGAVRVVNPTLLERLARR